MWINCSRSQYQFCTRLISSRPGMFGWQKVLRTNNTRFVFTFKPQKASESECIFAKGTRCLHNMIIQSPEAPPNSYTPKLSEFIFNSKRLPNETNSTLRPRHLSTYFNYKHKYMRHHCHVLEKRIPHTGLIVSLFVHRLHAYSIFVFGVNLMPLPLRMFHVVRPNGE